MKRGTLLITLAAFFPLWGCGGDAPPRKPPVKKPSADALAEDPAKKDEHSDDDHDHDKDPKDDPKNQDVIEKENLDPVRMAVVQRNFDAAVISDKRVKFILGSKQVEQTIAMRRERKMMFKTFGPYAQVSDVPSTFDIGLNIDTTSVVVTIDNKVFKDFVYDGESGQVTLNTIPPTTMRIVIRFEQIGDPVLAYAVSFPKQVASVSARDASTASPLLISVAGNSVTFASADFIDGRTVRLQYEDPNGGLNTLTLPDAPLAKSMVINGGKPVCDGTGTINVTDKEISLESCMVIQEVTSIDVEYKFVESLVEEFAMSVSGAKDGGKKVWSVYVDSVLVTDYQVKENVVTFAKPLAFDAKVKIVVEYEIAGATGTN